MTPGGARLAPGAARSAGRVRPGASSGRLLHEGGGVLARGCPYCTRPRPPWSTPECWPVASHPRAVHAEPPPQRTSALLQRRDQAIPAPGHPTRVSDVMTSETLRSHETTRRPRPSWSRPDCRPTAPRPRGVHPRAGESHPRFVQYAPSATKAAVHDPSATRSHRTSARTSATSRATRFEDVLSARGLRFITDD